MNRMRALMISTVFAVMTLGVQAVHATCPIVYRLYYKHGTETCRLYGVYEGRCQYFCSFEVGAVWA